MHRGKETKEKGWKKIKNKIDESLLLIKGNLLIIAHILFKFWIRNHWGRNQFPLMCICCSCEIKSHHHCNPKIYP